MSKTEINKSAGFGAVGVVIIVVAVAFVGLVAWRVYDASKTKSTSSTSQGSSSTGNSQANNQTPPTDPYAGWKTYCDAVERACFKYPSDWTISPSSQNNIVSVTLKSSTGSVLGGYTNYDTRDGAQVPYYTASLDDLTTVNASYKVVGGFDASSASVYPRYKVVDVSSTTGLTAGQQTTMTNTARFTFKDKNTGHLEIYPTSTTGLTADQAKTWFTSSDAKTALLIAQSFYLE